MDEFNLGVGNRLLMVVEIGHSDREVNILATRLIEFYQCLNWAILKEYIMQKYTLRALTVQLVSEQAMVTVDVFDV